MNVECHAPAVCPFPRWAFVVGGLAVNSNENFLDPVGNRTPGCQTHSWVINHTPVGVLAQHTKQGRAVHIATVTAQWRSTVPPLFHASGVLCHT